MDDAGVEAGGDGMMSSDEAHRIAWSASFVNETSIYDAVCAGIMDNAKRGLFQFLVAYPKMSVSEASIFNVGQRIKRLGYEVSTESTDSFNGLIVRW